MITEFLCVFPRRWEVRRGSSLVSKAFVYHLAREREDCLRNSSRDQYSWCPKWGTEVPGVAEAYEAGTENGKGDTWEVGRYQENQVPNDHSAHQQCPRVSRGSGQMRTDWVVFQKAREDRL